jgi:GR25 family glycosyltransferase involved in LPS biosynthesis
MRLDVKVGIVSHESRMMRATNLFHEIEADQIFTDDGTLGCEGNHRRAWAELARNARVSQWIVVMEDDAIPCEDFNAQVEAALDVCPVDVASFYLGRSRPIAWQTFIEPAVARADSEHACWITSDATIHAVCIAIRGPELVEMMLNRTSKHIRPIDQRISFWCRQFGHETAYSWPSLVDHDDDLPSTIVQRADGEEREKGRVAWRFGTRDRWTSRSIKLRQ